MQLRDVNQRSLGHSNQKLWPKVDFGEFHHVYPLEHLKSFATDRLWVYKAEIFFVAFSRYIYSAVSTIKQNLKKWLFWDIEFKYLPLYNITLDTRLQLKKESSDQT